MGAMRFKYFCTSASFDSVAHVAQLELRLFPLSYPQSAESLASAAVRHCVRHFALEHCTVGLPIHSILELF
eukprot:1622741-Pleurochrysis_carterae.AAC.1